MNIFENTLAYARQEDATDPLRNYRNRFHIPKIKGREAIYFTGNSLGLQPKSTAQYVNQELADWAALGVEGHYKASKYPWFHYHKFSKEALATLAGASPEEVVSMNSLTTNLHLMMASFYRPTATRYKILIEAGAFPSDQYAVESQLRLHGFDPENGIVEVRPHPGEHTLRTEDIVSEIEKQGDSLALVLFGGVQYYTGQLFDLKSITAAAHKVGAYCGFDLAHAMGNVPLQLHDDGVDFAAWCSYKYLNSGPGGMSGIFVHEKHGNNPDTPRMAGWWGYEETTRFDMKKGFVPMPGADGWQLSNVNVISGAVHLAALEIHHEAGITTLREKSLKLTGYMHYLLQTSGMDGDVLEIITPEDESQRGCQLSLLVRDKGRERFEALTEAGVIADWREPGVIRVAPVPLYNTFEEVFRFCEILGNNSK